MATFAHEQMVKEGSPFRRTPLGSGFFVSTDGHVITANHVLQSIAMVAGSVPAEDEYAYLGIAMPNEEGFRANFRALKFEVVDTDTVHDLALIRAATSPFEGELGPKVISSGKSMVTEVDVGTLRTARPKDGQEIAISGFPFGEPVLVTSGGWMASSWAINKVEPGTPGAKAIENVYLADVESNPGNSGGPVYLIEDASVVGVCIGTRRTGVVDASGEVKPDHFTSSSLTHVIPTEYVVELLDKNSVVWTSV